MSIEEQQLAAETATEQTETDLSKTGETDGSVTSEEQIAETEEEKNTRILAEAAETARKREEKRQNGVQKRMNEITAEKHAERQRADQLAAMNERLLAAIEGKSSQSQVSNAEPTRDQFDSYEDFLTARAEFRAETKAVEATRKAIEEFTHKQQETQTISTLEAERQQVEKQFLERRSEVMKKFPDYQEVVEDWDPKLPADVIDLIVKIPEGPLLSYHLAKNPALEAQFRNQPAHMHGILLGQLLTTLKSTAKETAAPKPGKPVTGKSTSTEGGYSGDPEGYYAWAQKNLR